MKLFLAFYLFLESAIAVAGVWTPRFGKTNVVTWEAKGFPGFLRINGKGGSVSGTADIYNGMMRASFRVDLSKFETGLTLRDTHMHDKYLDTKKFKYSGLVIDRVTAEQGNHTFQGRLTIKDETQPITGKISIRDVDKKTKHIKAEFVVTINKYPKIGVPAWAGVTMAEKVDVDVTFFLAEQ